MGTFRRAWTAFTIAAAVLIVAASPAVAELVEGRDWEPVPGGEGAERGPAIEVLEFFSYGCPHCSDINPLIKTWAEDLPGDVRFERVPVTFGRAAWESLARLFYALEFAGELERLDQPVFDAVTEQRTNLYTKKAVLDWIAGHDVDATEFAKLWDSFAVEAALARANTAAARYQVDAVPRIIVDGRYQVLGKGARSKAQLLEITDQLIDKARSARQ